MDTDSKNCLGNNAAAPVVCGQGSLNRVESIRRHTRSAAYLCATFPDFCFSARINTPRSGPVHSIKLVPKCGFAPKGNAACNLDDPS